MPVDAQLATDDALAAKKAAKAEYDRQYRAKNAEKIKAQKKAWIRRGVFYSARPPEGI